MNTSLMEMVPETPDGPRPERYISLARFLQIALAIAVGRCGPQRQLGCGLRHPGQRLRPIFRSGKLAGRPGNVEEPAP